MDRDQAHKLVDQLFDRAENQKIEQNESTKIEVKAVEPEQKANTTEKKRELPKNKRVVRTKQSGDRVYLLDEEKKTRQWLTNPEVMKKLGFEMGDVKEVKDEEILTYAMGSAIYRVDG